MLSISIYMNPLTCRAHSGLIGIGLLLLSGCSSPSFVNPPPAAYLVPLPGAINGIWANEVDNGERVRLSGQKDGTLRFDFSKVVPSNDPAYAKPLFAQTLRFDNTDWLLLDWRKLADWQGEQYTERSQYRLLKYSLEDPDRLCGTEMSTSIFAEAIESGQLTGTVDASGAIDEPTKIVTVTSPGADWVKWWTTLPEDKKTFEATFCFRRVK